MMAARNERSLQSISSLTGTLAQWCWSILATLGITSRESRLNLSALESKILSHVRQSVQGQFVNIGGDRNVWTLCYNAFASVRPGRPTTTRSTPLVLLHGIGAGTAMWVLNVDALATHRPVYVVDMLGFGRSSRTTFSEDASVAEMELVEALECWRKEVGLQKFILVGHCFGGYIAAAYTIRYPDRVRHLILVDPWGFAEPRKTLKSMIPLPFWVKLILLTAQPFNPLAPLRLAGALWGPALVARFKPDLIQNFNHLFNDNTIAEYIYMWNASTPTGETAFKHMSHDFGWALYPMLQRIKDIPPYISITCIFGSRSWIDSSLGQSIKDARSDSYVDVQIIRGAGHFVFADKAELFNSLVTKTCTVVDHRLDILQPLSCNVPRNVSRSLSRGRAGERRRLRSESAPDLNKLQGAGRPHRNSECLAEEEEELTPTRFVISDDDE